MGRSASHVTLECALTTQPNVALIGEEVEARQWTLREIVEQLVRAVKRRADAGRSYGVCLVSEGLIEFIPEMRRLIDELNQVMSEHANALGEQPSYDARRELVAERLGADSRAVFDELPERIQAQLLLDRDSHGNVQVSKIDTEQLLLEKVSQRLAELQSRGEYAGKFQVQAHFLGYEGRAAAPSDFDCDYTYALGQVAAMLIAFGRTGYLCSLRRLSGSPESWEPVGVPLTSLMQIEQRKGKPTPVIGKALVRLDAEPFKALAASREGWEESDAYVYPGPIQYFGPSEITGDRSRTLVLERGRG